MIPRPFPAPSSFLLVFGCSELNLHSCNCHEERQGAMQELAQCGFSLFTFAHGRHH